MRRTYIFDTNVLFDYLVGHYAVEHGRQRLWAHARFLSTEQRWLRFREFLRRCYPFVTVPGVLVELEYRFRHLESQRAWGHADRTPFWRLVRRELPTSRMAEECVLLGDMALEVLGEHGPVDAALLAVGLRYVGEHRNVAIVTEDGPLRGRCRSHEVPAVSMYELMQ